MAATTQLGHTQVCQVRVVPDDGDSPSARSLHGGGAINTPCMYLDARLLLPRQDGGVATAAVVQVDTRNDGTASTPASSIPSRSILLQALTAPTPLTAQSSTGSIATGDQGAGMDNDATTLGASEASTVGLPTVCIPRWVARRFALTPRYDVATTVLVTPLYGPVPTLATAVLVTGLKQSAVVADAVQRAVSAAHHVLVHKGHPIPLALPHSHTAVLAYSDPVVQGMYAPRRSRRAFKHVSSTRSTNYTLLFQ